MMKKTVQHFFGFLSLFIFLTGCSSSGGATDKLEGDFEFQVQDFSYVNQNNETISLNDLKGEPWLADFVFTNCNTVCPPMTANMARLQEKFKEENLDMQLISFSVDPENDHPKTLTEFANKFEADFNSWAFLTGYTQEEIAEFSMDSFKALVKNDPNSDQVIHVTSFYLVDENGYAIKRYDGLDVPYEEILADVRTLKE